MQSSLVLEVMMIVLRESGYYCIIFNQGFRSSMLQILTRS
jgi:hypothetical protein